MRKAHMFVLVFLLMITGSSALAHQETGSAAKPLPETVARLAPADPHYQPPPVRPGASTGWHTDATVGGEGGAQTDHWSLIPHTHTFMGIYNTYDGRDPDERLVGPMSCPPGGSTSCSISYARQRGWTHKWGVNINFAVEPVRVGVGYDVTYSSSHTVTYSVTFQPGFTAELWSNEWYHVREYNVKNTWCYPSSSYPYCWNEFGTGWAAQWFKTQVDPRIWRT